MPMDTQDLRKQIDSQRPFSMLVRTPLDRGVKSSGRQSLPDDPHNLARVVYRHATIFTILQSFGNYYYIHIIYIIASALIPFMAHYSDTERSSIPNNSTST